MMNAQRGFTLIEIMVAVSIIAILSAIAIPSYQRYVVQNAEDLAKSQMGQLEIELARWRATALTYRGFVPLKVENGVQSYGYTTGNTIMVPLGSNNGNYKYIIQVFDSGTAGALNANLGTVNAVAGRGYTLVASPNPDLQQKGAKQFIATSLGFKCSGTANLSNILQPNCGANAGTW